jgi:LacI family transcriptional regulator
VKRKPVTQAQIAREANVTPAVVSVVLSGAVDSTLQVSPETRREVLKIAEKLGYVRKKQPAGGAARRSSISRSEKRVALIVQSSWWEVTKEQDWLVSTYESLMGQVFSSTSFHLHKEGYGLSVFNIGDDPHRLTEWLAESDVEGVLWHASDKHTELLYWVASRFPLVLLNREWTSSVPVDAAIIDQEKNIQLAIGHLYERGHRRIAVFGHGPAGNMFRRRMSAYHWFVAEHGLRDYVEFQQISDAPEINAATKVGEIIRTWRALGKEAPTALVTGDIFALPLLREARKAGIVIPGDLSVIGIDNTAACEVVEPRLTSVAEPFGEVCRVAVDLLLRRKAQPDSFSQTIQIAPRLIERDSVRSLKKASGRFSPIAV